MEEVGCVKQQAEYKPHMSQKVRKLQRSNQETFIHGCRISIRKTPFCCIVVCLQIDLRVNTTDKERK